MIVSDYTVHKCAVFDVSKYPLLVGQKKEGAKKRKAKKRLFCGKSKRKADC